MEGKFFAVIIIVALLGGLASLGLAKTDFTNPNTSAAEARAIDQRTTIDSKKAEIDLRVYETSLQNQAQAEKDKADLSLAIQRQRNELELQQMVADRQRELDKQRALDQVRVEAERVFNLAVVITISLVVLMSFGGLTISAVRFSQSRLQPVAANTWDRDLVLRKHLIALARQREQEMRIASLAHSTNEAYASLFQNKREAVIHQ